MSQALWCKAGEHAFDGDDPARETFERRRKNANGLVIKTAVDICGEHMQSGPFQGMSAVEGSQPENDVASDVPEDLQ
jgi:hypothetical protein